MVLGTAGYALSLSVLRRRMEALIGGSGRLRVDRAQRLALTSYLAGGLVSVLIGLFNPLGPVIVLTSAAAASLGGASGLAWGMQLMDRTRVSRQPPLALRRSWPWITVSLLLTLIYAVVLGPSLHPASGRSGAVPQRAGGSAPPQSLPGQPPA